MWRKEGVLTSINRHKEKKRKREKGWEGGALYIERKSFRMPRIALRRASTMPDWPIKEANLYQGSKGELTPPRSSSSLFFSILGNRKKQNHEEHPSSSHLVRLANLRDKDIFDQLFS